MAEAELQTIAKQLHQSLHSHNYSQSQQLLSRAKVALLHLNALIPSAQTPRNHLLAAREILELGAIISIRMNNEQSPDSFTRYFQQLQPFYALSSSQLPTENSQQSRVTGLYLLLLLSTGDYGGFHTMLETLEMARANAGRKRLEDDDFIQYPVRLEQALMEGSYDRVWQQTKASNVPGEEYAIFSGVSAPHSQPMWQSDADPDTQFLINTIRDEIASCSEKAYASIPIANAKNLFFLDSEGAVVQFAQLRDWITKDGRIYFPQQDQDLLASEKDILSASDQVIENTLGYARELETIV